MKKLSWGVFAVLACSMFHAQAETIVALTADKKLRHFSSTAPGAWTKIVQITGIPAARSMVGLDFRPDGSLVVLAHEGDKLYSYEVNPETGAAVQQARIVQGGIAAGAPVGFDTFARGVRIYDLALALNDPDFMVRYWFSGETWGSAGGVFLHYKLGPGGGSPDLTMVAMAASNSFPQAEASVLYGIDALANTLVKIEWETGLIEKVAPVRNASNTIVPTPPRTGFDISGVTGIAYLSIPSGSATALHKLDLTTGKTAKVGTIGSASPAPGEVVMDISAAPPTQLVNLSTRSRVGTSEDVMIAGFIAHGRAPTRLLIRGIGPSLSGSGVVGPLEDPVLTIFDANGVEVASNDNWKSHQQTEIRATGVAPHNDAEAAYVGTFTPGAYTAKVSGKGGGTGVGLVEIFRLE